MTRKGSATPTMTQSAALPYQCLVCSCRDHRIPIAHRTENSVIYRHPSSICQTRARQQTPRRYCCSVDADDRYSGTNVARTCRTRASIHIQSFQVLLPGNVAHLPGMETECKTIDEDIMRRKRRGLISSCRADQSDLRGALGTIHGNNHKKANNCPFAWNTRIHLQC